MPTVRLPALHDLQWGVTECEWVPISEVEVGSIRQAYRPHLA